MDKQKIDFFLISKGDCFPPERIPELRDKLLELDDTKGMMVECVEFRNPTTMLILSLLVGELGVDRFLLDEVGLGVLKLITCGGCGVWWLIDLFSVQKKSREYNYRKLLQYLMY